MLVRGEDLDRFARVLCRLLGNGIRELFLNAAASSGVADFGFFGRGFWIDQPIAFNASQPRCGATEVTLSSPAIQAATLRPAMRWHPHIPQTALPTPRHSNDPRPSPCVPISQLMAPKLICFARPCESLSTSKSISRKPYHCIRISKRRPRRFCGYDYPRICKRRNKHRGTK